MTTIDRTITIDATADRVWPALADFGAIATWNPSVRSSQLTSTADEGVGITRECSLAPMGTVKERVTTWDEGRLLGVEIFEFHNVPAMRTASATFALEPRGDRTEVKLRLDYEVGLGPVGAGMNAMMLRRQFATTATRMVAGLKHYVESGDPVDKHTDLPLDAVGTAA